MSLVFYLRALFRTVVVKESYVVLPCNVVKKVREGFLENSMKSEEPHKRQSGGEEKEAHSGRGNHR